jgi:hypothetical protein
MCQKRSACKYLIGIPEENRPLGGPRRMREDNIKNGLTELKQEGCCEHGNGPRI